MRSKNFLMLAAALLLMGCGGEGDVGKGEVTGVVFDEDGNVVRDATIYVDGGPTTRSNSSGAFVLRDVAAQDIVVKAEAFDTQNRRFFGRNVARIFQNERTRSVNIAVYPDNQIGRISGFVFDAQSRAIEGARVFARQAATDTVLTSSYAITDSQGRYVIDGLHGGTNYEVVSNARFFGEQSYTVAPISGTSVRRDFTLGDAANVNIPAPQNVQATAYTSPSEVTRNAKLGQALEAMKRILDPKRASRTAKTSRTLKTRDAANGYPIEVDLDWDGLNFTDILGYGVYRATGSGSLANVDFYRDPLAQYYEDSDANLFEGQSYSYGLTTLSTSFDTAGGGSTGESAISNLSTVTPLGALVSNQVVVNGSSINFSWQPAQGATQYSVFIFDNYPTIGEVSRFDNNSTPVSGTAYTYGGPTLQSDRTYYYILLARNGDGSARSLSRVGNFVAP